MARPNFFNENSNRSFPFLKRERLNAPVTINNIPDSTIVDFGATMSIGSGFDEALHYIELHQIIRVGPSVRFSFRTNAPNVANYHVDFNRSINSTDYITTYSDAFLALPSGEDESINVQDCNTAPRWSAYLTTGPLAELAAFLSSGSITADPLIIEPGLIQNQSGSFVGSINVANGDRTRATTPSNCKDLVWKQPHSEIYVGASCLTGPLRFEEGYNATIIQTPSENSITIGASVGAGAGEVCDPVPVFANEIPPFGGTNLEGADDCTDVVRSINGVGGRVLEVKAGPGVSVTPRLGENILNVAVDLSRLKACIDLPTPVEESLCSVSPDIDVSCGPLE